MWIVPGSVDDVVVLNGGDPVFVKQLTKLRSLKARETIVAKGDGTSALGGCATLGLRLAVIRGSVGEGERRERGECMWDIVLHGTTECLKARGMPTRRGQSHQHHHTTIMIRGLPDQLW